MIFALMTLLLRTLIFYLHLQSSQSASGNSWTPTELCKARQGIYLHYKEYLVPFISLACLTTSTNPSWYGHLPPNLINITFRIFFHSFYSSSKPPHQIKGFTFLKILRSCVAFTIQSFIKQQYVVKSNVIYKMKCALRSQHIQSANFWG